ncbi:Zinc-type alcohol dehydrogenase-like protein [Fusarium oxysporum f. sp. cubense]|uniref:Zinc-type alcohol dehydrogenase-like protein n=1 Tax=Fusarium oxysporum f. sp. cubense TaxID=61366 RepID=A0A559LXY8_FUSOC|nr:Zinc-type alcohol dehydrogenase-like protein [Fusarium oxysporum f. sp. cubense]
MMTSTRFALLGSSGRPASDGANEVVEVGSGVSKWKKGDRVITLFNQSHQFGPISPTIAATGLGGTIDDILRQYGVFNEDGVVRAPSNVGFAEASTLTGAPLTSWNALYGFRPLKAGETVLVQGTGGVSISALQLAKAGGAKVIAITSSLEKAEKLKALGADHVINHKENPEWGPIARKSTHDESGSLKAIKYQGVMSLIGFLGANSGEAPPSALETLSSMCIMRAIYVDSKAQMEEMVTAYENDIHPAVDSKSFTVEQAKEAFEYLGAQKHIGKVCVQIE